jgi:hypothetical protein
MNKLFFILSFTVCIASAVCQAGTDAAAFLQKGAGARALGMGEAYTSLSDDPSAVYWNPAGLAKVDKISVTAMGQSLGSAQWDTLASITPSYQFVGVAVPMKIFDKANLLGTNNTLGFGMLSNNLAGVSYNTVDSAGYIIRDTFDDSESAYFLSYGFSFLGQNDLSMGVTLRYITQTFTKIDGATAAGYDMVAGLMYDWDKKTRLGITIQRGAEISWANGHQDSSPLTTKLGMSRKFQPMKSVKSLSLLGSLDIVQQQDLPLYGYIGSELAFEPKVGFAIMSLDGIYLRLGVDGIALEDRFGNVSQLNNNLNACLGLGLKMNCFGYGLALDYVMGSYRLGGINSFSVNLYF